MPGKLYHGPEYHWGARAASAEDSLFAASGSGEEKARGAAATMAKRRDLREDIVSKEG